MAFNFGSLVGGLFDGFKAVQDIVKARNDLQLQSMIFEAADAAKKEMEKGEVANTIARALYPEDAIPDNPATTGSSTAPLPEQQSPEARDAASKGGRGGWGLLAPVAVKHLSSLGLEEAAVQGIMANGLGEGGFSTPWLKSGVPTAGGGTENSFGHWQFYDRGELPAYLKWAAGRGDPQDTKLQAEFVAHRMEEIYPGFSKITDPKLATDLVATKFERYKGAAPGQRYGYLADVQKAMSGLPPEPRNDVSQVPTYDVGLRKAPTPSALGDLTAVPDYSGAMGAPAPGPQMSPSGMGTGLAPPTGTLPQSALSGAPTGVSTALAPPPPPMTAPGAPAKVITVPPRQGAALPPLSSSAFPNSSGLPLLPSRARIGPDGMPSLPADATREEMDAAYDYVDAKSRSAPARQPSSALF